jgi:hypothetical protein
MKVAIAIAACVLLTSVAHAQPSCMAQSAEKKLAGAAQKSFMTKCEADANAACEKSAEKHCARNYRARKHAQQIQPREVNPRAKNLLGLVQAFTVHTTVADRDDFIGVSKGRLQALAAATTSHRQVLDEDGPPLDFSLTSPICGCSMKSEDG